MDNQETVNKAKAGQTIPLKWQAERSSFATSWEDYYRYNTESNGGQTRLRPMVRSALGRLTRSSSRLAAPTSSDRARTRTAQGNGFLIDNVEYASAAIGTLLPVRRQGVGDPSVYGNPPSRRRVEDCEDLDGDADPIETYTLERRAA